MRRPSATNAAQTASSTPSDGASKRPTIARTPQPVIVAVPNTSLSSRAQHEFSLP